MQRMQIGTVYETMAKLLPVEGRDYTLDIRFNEQGRMILNMQGLTEVGTLWTAYLNSALPRYLGKPVEKKDGQQETELEPSPVPVPQLP